MGKWIDADALIDDLYEHEFSNWCDKDEVSTLVNDAPSIDIVFCKECKKHNTHRCHMAFDLVATNDDDFCSYGEREGE